MELELLPQQFTVCRLADTSSFAPDTPFAFYARTDEEISLVCPTECTPKNTTTRKDGWYALRVVGELDFSLTGILADIANVLRAQSIFAISTYNTDYILVREPEKAVAALRAAGYAL